MGKTTKTKSDWNKGTRSVNVTNEDDKGNTKTTHYKETLNPIIPNSVAINRGLIPIYDLFDIAYQGGPRNEQP